MSQTIARLSVNSYGGQQKYLFDYVIKKDQKVAVGSIVRVDLRGKDSLGIVCEILPTKLPYTKKLLDIKEVLEIGPLPTNSLKLAAWMSDYYCATDKAIWGTILPSGLRAKSRKQIVEKLFNKVSPLPFQLTPTQEQVYRDIKDNGQFFLLHGVTGSGKTEIYLKLIADMIKKGQSALFLVPEIVLTPQMIARVQDVFGEQILCYHSKLTTAERKAIWLYVLKSSHPVIMVGTRSSLFLPFKKLGLIIVDEEHESSYKQGSSPRYLARDVAAKLAHLHHAQLVLGSATPSVTSYYLAGLGKLRLLTLEERYGEARLPKIQIIDLSNKQTFL